MKLANLAFIAALALGGTSCKIFVDPVEKSEYDKDRKAQDEKDNAQDEAIAANLTAILSLQGQLSTVNSELERIETKIGTDVEALRVSVASDLAAEVSTLNSSISSNVATLNASIEAQRVSLQAQITTNLNSIVAINASLTSLGTQASSLSAALASLTLEFEAAKAKLALLPEIFIAKGNPINGEASLEPAIGDGEYTSFTDFGLKNKDIFIDLLTGKFYLYIDTPAVGAVPAVQMWVEIVDVAIQDELPVPLTETEIKALIDAAIANQDFSVIDDKVNKLLDLLVDADEDGEIDVIAEAIALLRGEIEELDLEEYIDDDSDLLASIEELEKKVSAFEFVLEDAEIVHYFQSYPPTNDEINALEIGDIVIVLDTWNIYRVIAPPVGQSGYSLDPIYPEPAS